MVAQFISVHKVPHPETHCVMKPPWQLLLGDFSGLDPMEERFLLILPPTSGARARVRLVSVLRRFGRLRGFGLLDERTVVFVVGMIF